MSLLSKGDEQAFNLLYTRYWEDLYKTAFYILRNQDACKDIIQDVFVWTWENKEGLSIQSPKSYFRAAVKFKIANYIRSGNIRDGFFTELMKFEQSNRVISGSEEVAEVRELNNVIQQAISHLPFKCREIFKLSRESGLSNREIAEKLGISVKTVENQITIAIHRIRSEVQVYIATLCLLSAISQG